MKCSRLVFVLALAASTASPATAEAFMRPSPRPAERVHRDPDGLAWIELAPGSGAQAGPTDTITVHYVGRLTTGAEFDNSRVRGAPAKFALGKHALIAGFERGVVGMRVGGRRKLTIPPALGYGAKGAPPMIPADATLEFEVELVAIG